MDTYEVTNSAGRRFRIEKYAPGERTQGGGDIKKPAIGIFDLTHTDKFGERGQHVSSYYIEHLPTQLGLDLHAGVPEWRLDRDTITRIHTWLATGERLSSEADARCAQCGLTGQTRPPLYALPHTRADAPGVPCKYVRIYDRRFLPEDVVEGDITSDNVREEIVDCTEGDWDSIDIAIPAITEEGLTFEGSTQWASDPEGSQIVDHYTGECSERSAHLYGFTEAEHAQIIAAVKAKD